MLSNWTGTRTSGDAELLLSELELRARRPERPRKHGNERRGHVVISRRARREMPTPR